MTMRFISHLRPATVDYITTHSQTPIFRIVSRVDKRYI